MALHDPMPEPDSTPADTPATAPAHEGAQVVGHGPEQRSREVGGRPGPDPVRYGDWEKNGRCIDF